MPKKAHCMQISKTAHSTWHKSPTLHDSHWSYWPFPCLSLLPLLEIGLFLIHCLDCYPHVSVRFLVPRYKAVKPLQKSPANLISTVIKSYCPSGFVYSGSCFCMPSYRGSPSVTFQCLPPPQFSRRHDILINMLGPWECQSWNWI